MRYYLLALLGICLASCAKEKENVLCNAIGYFETIHVVSLIDKDSNNLLLNKTVDTTDITVKDADGSLLKFQPLLDSTLTKVRYITLPFKDKNGSRSLSVIVKGQTSTISYKRRFHYDRCFSYYAYTDFRLNDAPYSVKAKQDYIFVNYNNDEIAKYPVFLHLLYITQE